jgi:hypothetical protein
MTKSNCLFGLAALLLCLLANTAIAGSEEDLIALDKQWGEAGMAGDTDTVAVLLSDDLVAVDGSGVGGKAEQLADNEPAPEGATYEVDNYSVTFLDEDTAIMTHSVMGDEAHYSLHVWSNIDGNWQVVATASVVAESE